MQPHVDAITAKGDAFVLEPQALFHSRSAAQLDVSAGPHHPVPGDGAVRRAQ
jgi:hypothetical protein